MNLIELVHEHMPRAEAEQLIPADVFFAKTINPFKKKKKSPFCYRAVNIFIDRSTVTYVW